MSEPAKRTEVAQLRDAPVPQTDSAAILSVIERAALNPDVDVEKMERLYAMAERAHERQARMAYTSSLAELQPKLPVIDERGGIKNSSGAVQSTYAKWEDINDAIRPLLAEHGFALSFRTGMAPDGKVEVTGVLSHREGHQEETTITLPHDSSGSKNSVQAVGSSTSYGKRYTTIALLNITSRARGDRDDNGREADRGFYITPDQIGDLQALIDETSADRAGFLTYMGAAALKDIPGRDYQKAVNALQAKRRQAR